MEMVKEIDFYDLEWDDAIIKNIKIDRSNAGHSDIDGSLIIHDGSIKTNAYNFSLQ